MEEIQHQLGCMAKTGIYESPGTLGDIGNSTGSRAAGGISFFFEGEEPEYTPEYLGNLGKACFRPACGAESHRSSTATNGVPFRFLHDRS